MLADVITIFSSPKIFGQLSIPDCEATDSEMDAVWTALELCMKKKVRRCLVLRILTDPLLTLELPALQSIYEETLVNMDTSPSSVEILARLCASGDSSPFRSMAGKLLSYWDSPEIPSELAPVFKDVARRLKNLDPKSLADIYLSAMQHSYTRYKAFLQNLPTEEEREEKAEDAIGPFLILSHKIAQSYASLNSPALMMAYIAEHGATWALRNPPQSLEFLQGASYFVVKVKGDSAVSVLRSLEHAAANAGAPNEEEGDIGDWELFFEYCDVLRTQSLKQREPAAPRQGRPKSNEKRNSIALGNDEFDTDVPESVTRRRSGRFAAAKSTPDYKEKYSDDEDILPTEEHLP